MSVNNAQEIARTVIAHDLIEHPGWKEIVLKHVSKSVTASYKVLAFGTLDWQDAQRVRGVLKAMSDLIRDIYREAEQPIPDSIKQFLDPQ